MNPQLQRIVGAVGTVAVAAMVNVATSFLTDHRAVAWWASGVVLLVLGTAVQWLLPVHGLRRQSLKDNKVGGSVRQRADGPALQEASGNEIAGDLTQSQNG